MQYAIGLGLFLLIVLTPRCAIADSLSFKYGLGVIEGAPTTKVKAFGLRAEQSLPRFFPIHVAYESGLWTDTGSAQGRSSSAYLAAQFGLRPQSEHFYAKSFIGPCVIAAPDSLLGGRFPQFRFDMGIGFQDRDSFVGLNLSHISSAGIYSPNKGRDFLGAEIGLRF
jgi:hypothetical protein